MTIPLVALLVSMAALVITMISSTVVIVWKFSGLASKMEDLTFQLKDLVAEFRVERNKIAELATSRAVVEMRLNSAEDRLDNLERNA